MLLYVHFVFYFKLLIYIIFN